MLRAGGGAWRPLRAPMSDMHRVPGPLSFQRRTRSSTRDDMNGISGRQAGPSGARGLVFLLACLLLATAAGQPVPTSSSSGASVPLLKAILQQFAGKFG
jgi:hypothetical protein